MSVVWPSLVGIGLKCGWRSLCLILCEISVSKMTILAIVSMCALSVFFSLKEVMVWDAMRYPTIKFLAVNIVSPCEPHPRFFFRRFQFLAFFQPKKVSLFFDSTVNSGFSSQFSDKNILRPKSRDHLLVQGISFWNVYWLWQTEICKLKFFWIQFFGRFGQRSFFMFAWAKWMKR